jgi:NADP-dependent 3-hydroxy acid dehydrogenase YdfG
MDGPVSARGVLFVIGAGPGVGAAVARRFGQHGHGIGLVARNRERLMAATRELRAQGIAAEYAVADVRDPAEVGRVLPSMRATGR